VSTALTHRRSINIHRLEAKIKDVEDDPHQPIGPAHHENEIMTNAPSGEAAQNGNGHPLVNGNPYEALSVNVAAPLEGTQPTTANGDGTNWALVNHLLNYPVINDGVATLKSSPIAQQSLKLGDKAYRTFAAPVLPYFSWPLQLIAPYAKKADDIGDKTLSTFDEKFPIVHKATEDIINDARSLATIPLRVGQDAKEHVLSTYGAELEKVGHNGLLGGRGKAAVTTAIALTTEYLPKVSPYLYENREQAPAEEKITSA